MPSLRELVKNELLFVSDLALLQIAFLGSTLSLLYSSICGALWDLVPFVQFKKREKHPCRSFTFSKVAGKPATLLKVTLRHSTTTPFFKTVQMVPNCAKHRNYLVLAHF